MYYTYIIRCKDNSLYTGMTKDIDRRFKEHLSKKGAKYTMSHEVEKLEAVWRSKERALACKLEFNIKKLSKIKKENLINGEKIQKYLKGKVDARRYYRVK